MPNRHRALSFFAGQVFNIKQRAAAPLGITGIISRPNVVLELSRVANAVR